MIWFFDVHWKMENLFLFVCECYLDFFVRKYILFQSDKGNFLNQIKVSSCHKYQVISSLYLVFSLLSWRVWKSWKILIQMTFLTTFWVKRIRKCENLKILCRLKRGERRGRVKRKLKLTIPIENLSLSSS